MKKWMVVFLLVLVGGCTHDVMMFLGDYGEHQQEHHHPEHHDDDHHHDD